MDSFLSLANCKDPKDAMRYSAPVGSLRRWLEADRKTEVADDVTAEVRSSSCELRDLPCSEHRIGPGDSKV